MFFELAFMALLFEFCVGYPEGLFRAVGHPVTWAGALISGIERRLNREEWTGRRRRLAGLAALALFVTLAGAAGWAVQRIFGDGLALVFTAIAASSLLAQRSLSRHVTAVADALETGGLEAGRRAVSQIVGRDPDRLDEAGVARAAIESLAENYSDGVVAPLFWLTFAGLPGAAIYKMINTADSMIGHRTPRYEAFGWASARLDDFVNLPASRLTGLLFLGAAALLPGASVRQAARALLRDAGRHRSPNAGWPEAAMAGALGLALAGPRSYGGIETADAIMGEGGRRNAGPADIRRALALYRRADAILIGLSGLLALLAFLAGRASYFT